MNLNGNHMKACSVIMVICAVVMASFTMFSYLTSTGERSGSAEATTVLAQKNQQQVVALQITLGKLETQMTTISEDIVEIKQDIKRIRE